MIYHQNNTNKLRVLFDKIKDQNDSIKNGYMSDFTTLQKWLSKKDFDIFSYKLIDSKGAPTKIKPNRDKLFLLDFWFTNCPPCIADHKIINQRHTDFKKNNIEVIGISKDENFNKWKNYLTKHNYNWSNYKQVYSEKNIPTEDLGITAYPTYILVDDKGNIVSKRYNSIKEVAAEYTNK